MRNSEVISARLYPYDVDDNLVAVACMDTGLSADEEDSSSNKGPVAKAAIDVLKQLIVLSSESNGGCSFGYDVEELRRRIHALAKDNGLTDIASEFDPTPQIFFLDL